MGSLYVQIPRSSCLVKDYALYRFECRGEGPSGVNGIGGGATYYIFFTRRVDGYINLWVDVVIMKSPTSDIPVNLHLSRVGYAIEHCRLV